MNKIYPEMNLGQRWKGAETMIQSDAYSYVNVLDKALDASNLRETVITNNLANVNTPGYKRREVDFESLLRQELDQTKWESLDAKIQNVNLDHLDASVQYDLAAYGYDYRLDGNNVDVDVENVELASEQLRYQMLSDSVTQEFSRISTAIGS
jgi:flagellar basal-body rod protein FlgB